jgi:glycosyltransferase involved in cell wall biosynthesis
MNLLIFSQHFWPETFRINEVAKELSKKNNVYVVSSWPNYNIINKKKIFRYGFEKYESIKIIRVPTFKRNNNKFYNIILNYLSFIIGGLFIKKKQFNNINFDAIISYATSPIYQAIPAIIYAKRNNIPSFLWVQDLWPDVLKDLNIIKNKFILKILNQSTEYLYSQSNYLLAQSPNIKKILNKKFKNTLLVYNPSNINKFQNVQVKKNKIKKIVFAGNIGKAQALEKLINFGKFIKEDKLPLVFEIIGEGSNKKYLKKMVIEASLEKIIIFKDFMNPKIIEKYLLSADGLLVSLGTGRALSSTIPAKFQTYISYGKPIFTFSKNTVADIVKRYNVGFVINNKNFKKKILKFLNMNSRTSNLVRNNSKNMFDNLFEIKKNTKILEKIIKIGLNK